MQVFTFLSRAEGFNLGIKKKKSSSHRLLLVEEDGKGVPEVLVFRDFDIETK